MSAARVDLVIALLVPSGVLNLEISDCAKADYRDTRHADGVRKTIAAAFRVVELVLEENEMREAALKQHLRVQASVRKPWWKRKVALVDG